MRFRRVVLRKRGSEERLSSRLWIVSELYWPEETGSGHYVTGTAEGLVDIAPVFVVTGQPTYSMRGTRAPREEVHRGVRVFRVRSTTLDKDTGAGRLANAVTLTLALSVKLFVHSRRGDRLITTTNPATLPYLVGLVARLRRLDYHLILYDRFPYQLVASGAMSEDSVAFRALSSANRWLYRGASSIAVVGRDMEEQVRPLVDGSDAVVGFVPVWADVKRVHPRERRSSALLAAMGLQDKFVIQYAGNMGPLQNLPLILDAMQSLSGYPPIHLVAFGDGMMRSWLEGEIERRQLENITVCDPVRRSEAEKVHQACDIAIVSLDRRMTGAAVPSRLYNFMAAGRPIIAAVEPESEVARVVTESGIGWVTGTDDPDLLAAAILVAASAPERVRELGKKARNLAATEYTRTRTVDALAKLIVKGE